MQLLDKYCKTDFKNYRDFYENFELKIPENFNFAYDVVDEWARIEPEKLALKWCDDNDHVIDFTFSDISKKSQQVANFLVKSGVKRGDFVMLVLKRHHEFWPTLMALHRIGAIGVPATHLLTEKDYVYRFKSANITAIVATPDGDVCARIDEAQKSFENLKIKIVVRGERDGWLRFTEGVATQKDSFPRNNEGIDNDSPLLLYFTSGTTGEPKMVYHNYVYPLAHVMTSKFWHNTIENKLHLTVADTGWAKSVWGKLYGQWLCGSAVFVYDYSDRFTPMDLIKQIEKHRISTFCAPPTIFRYFINEDLSKYDLSCLEYCCIAGEPLNPEVYNKFFQQTGLKLYEGFGQTETVITLANYPWFEPRPGSMGKPSPSIYPEILNENGELCENGEIGELTYNTAKQVPYGIFKGYYKDDERTNEVWNNGRYYTGDLVWRDEDGFYWYVGRADDMIKSSGYRIGPFEVESALIEHEAVLETAITAVPDEMRGQIVKASIVLNKGFVASEQLAKELQDHVKKTTAPYKYPRIVEFVDKLPKTISGKIRRVEIRSEKK